MSGSLTPNFQFNLPSIGGNQDSWGNLLNANWSSLDTLLNNAASNATGFLPLTGGVISGSLAVQGAIQANATLGVRGACAFGFPTVNDFFMVLGDPNGGPSDRVLQWAANVKTDYNPNFGSFGWWHSGTAMLQIDSGGDLTINGNGFKPGGGVWASSSDNRVKRNIRPYGSGLAEVCDLQPISFEYNGEGRTVDDGQTFIGLSAQATQPVMPELVIDMCRPRLDGSIDPRLLPGQLGTQLGPLTMALVNGMRELRDRVVALEHAA